ncbi:MAG: sortase [Clostridia bacterium]|mgnify:CR=1 FL=1|jgi:sortase family protein
MNQILITEKIYITPELKKKKRMYKFNFIISIILIVVLFSFYAYAEYDRNKTADISQEILLGTSNTDNTTMKSDSDVWIVALDGNDDVVESDIKENTQGEASTNTSQKNPAFTSAKSTYTASNGKTYEIVGKVKIPSINVDYSILSKTSDELLKVSVCKFWGSNPNEIGNLCIAGHNYRNKRFFSKVPTLKVGDIIEITDLNNTTLKYSVYDKYTVDPTDTSCTSQITNGKKIVTLITCTDDSKQRVIVQAEAI